MDQNILSELAKPFNSYLVEFKPGALSKDKTRALALAYVEPRAYIARLNQVCPDWQDDYQIHILPDRVVVLCRLTIAGITRTGDGECLLTNGDEGDRTEANAVTTASAQAFKRACVKFGLGAYLYELPQTWVDYDAQKRAIVSPPKLPAWALPENERAITQGGNGKPAPAPAPAQPPSPDRQSFDRQVVENYVLPAGKYAGKTLLEVREQDPEYIEYLAREFEPKTPIQREIKSKALALIS